MSRRYESLTPVSAGSDRQGSSARHPRPRHPTGRAALHGRARQRPIQEVAASHASMVSQPEAVTRLILSAVEETSRSQL